MDKISHSCHIHNCFSHLACTVSCCSDSPQHSTTLLWRRWTNWVQSWNKFRKWSTSTCPNTDTHWCLSHSQITCHLPSTLLSHRLEGGTRRSDLIRYSCSRHISVSLEAVLGFMLKNNFMDILISNLHKILYCLSYNAMTVLQWWSSVGLWSLCWVSISPSLCL